MSKDLNPNWTKQDFKKAKLMQDVMPDVVEALKRPVGRPKSENPKTHIGMRLDSEVVDWLRGQDGYNALVNKVLQKEMKKQDLSPKL